MTEEINEPVLVDQVGIKPDRRMFDHLKPGEGPTWTTSQMAQTFFGRSYHWVRWRMKLGHFVPKDERIEIDDKGHPLDVAGRLGSNITRWGLSDIERAAHALRSHNAIDSRQLISCLKILHAQGSLHDLNRQD